MKTEIEDQFNPNEWQGRNKKNLESTYKAVGWTLILFLLLFIIARLLGV